MSLQTWKEEFYPINAQELAEGSELDAARHSLKKWEGLRQEALERHGVFLRSVNPSVMAVTDPVESLSIDFSSCSLCQKYPSDCDPCSLFIERGGVECDSERYDGDRYENDEPETISPFKALTKHLTPEPMIIWLQRTVDTLERQETPFDKMDGLLKDLGE